MSAAAFSARSLPNYKRGRSDIEVIAAYSIPVPVTGCWLWTGAGERYGHAKRNGRIVPAHRLSWSAHCGAIPEGMHVCHRCDVPLCVNPDHLFLGTHRDNMADKEAKGRGNQPNGIRNGRHTKPHRTARGDKNGARANPEMHQGERNGRAKLRAEDATAIRTSSKRNADLAREYGVSKTTIRDIRTGRLWRHL